MKTVAKLLMLSCAAVLSIGATNPGPRNWTQTVATTPAGGHVLGNSAAELKLVEFVSYTCPHCAHFEQQSESALKVGYVASGRVSVEVRPYVRDSVDMAVTLLTNCGPPAKFFQNHTLFLKMQDRWIAPLATSSATQRARWDRGPFAARMRFIATDLGLYALAAMRGYDRRAADACLADEAMARRLAAVGEAADQAGLTGTPAFMINDLLLAGTHDWRSLEAQLNARL